MKQLLKDLNIWPAKIKILKDLYYSRSKDKGCITLVSTPFISDISEIYILSDRKSDGFRESRYYDNDNRKGGWIDRENLYELVDEGAIEIL